MSRAFPSLSKLKFCALVPSYSPKYTSVYAWSQVLNDRCHPLFKKTIRNYERRDYSGLWWSATTSSHKQKRVIRSWVCRRVRQAFCEALESRGLDKYGKALVVAPAAGFSNAKRTKKLPDLYGTLRIGASEQTATAKYEELRKECDVLVDALLNLCKRTRDESDSRSTMPSYNRQGRTAAHLHPLSNLRADVQMTLSTAMASNDRWRAKQRSHQDKHAQALAV